MPHHTPPGQGGAVSATSRRLADGEHPREAASQDQLLLNNQWTPRPSSQVPASSLSVPHSHQDAIHHLRVQALSSQQLGLSFFQPCLKITTITSSRVREGRLHGDGSLRKWVGQESVRYPPSESMLLRAVGGMTDTLHRPSGHLVSRESLQDVCTWNQSRRITRGHWPPPHPPELSPACSCRSSGLSRTREQTRMQRRDEPTHEPAGPRAHSPWLCTRGSASPAGAARCRRSYRTPCTWHSRAGFPPATGEAWRSATQAETHSRGGPRAPRVGREALQQKCPQMNSTKTFFSTQAQGGQGSQCCPTPPLLLQRAARHTGTGQSSAHTEPPNTRWEQLK